jgi:hypothetical protein
MYTVYGVWYMVVRSAQRYATIRDPRILDSI